jgi:hypothetical protein
MEGLISGLVGGEEGVYQSRSHNYPSRWTSFNLAKLRSNVATGK